LLGLFEAAGWVDLWDRLHPGQAGYSFYENGRLTKRIDYAWARESLARRVKAIVVIPGPRGPVGERMSNHAAILVTLQDEGGNSSRSDPRDRLDGAH
jgi:exonuclease III